MPDRELRNPFQSEEDAFRILVMIIAAAVIVIACAVLISATLGAILAVDRDRRRAVEGGRLAERDARRARRGRSRERAA